jgi:glycosyltransferase involved in cell wall biosynthesis
MSRTWIDLTELAAWEGRLTGVPRVMNELSNRFSKEDDCIFVTWNGSLEGYQSIDYRAVDDGSNGTSQPPLPTDQSVRKLSGVISAAKSLKQQSRIANKAFIVPEKIARKLLVTKPSLESQPNQTVQPEKGDKLLVLADWHGSDRAFVEYLVGLKKAGVSLVQMSYDLLPIVTPQYSGHATESLTYYTKTIYPLCDLILAISEHTKKDITVWLEKNTLKVPKIEVIRLGDDFELAEPTKPSDIYFSSKVTDFILCVGTIEARKNHALLYYTYKLAKQRNVQLPNLVIVGRRGWKSDDVYELMTSDPQIKEKFIILEKANDEELSWLYKNCLFSIYPSFYEGWGLPIAESIAYGTPCICSNTSSMPEVAGDAVAYFSPFSTDECLAAIENLLKPDAAAAAKRTIKDYHPTSWDDTFTSVNRYIEEVHG